MIHKSMKRTMKNHPSNMYIFANLPTFKNGVNKGIFKIERVQNYTLEYVVFRKSR